MKKCFFCNQLSNDFVEYKGMLYCSDCIDEHFTLCMHCTDLTPNDAGVEDFEKGFLCSECATELKEERG